MIHTACGNALEGCDAVFMGEALAMARMAMAQGEVPVGAVIVQGGVVIARAHNCVEKKQCASAHAELLAIEAAAVVVQNWRLLDVTLYATLEPCAMCLGAMLLARVKRLVFAAPDIRHGACGSWVDLLATKHPTHTIEISRGVRAEEAAQLMRSFFRKRRSAKE